MINMHYCRFRNTLMALEECKDDLENNRSSKPFGDLSAEEKSAALKLLELCSDMVEDFGTLRGIK